MSLYIKNFVLICITTIVKKSAAETTYCDYIDTVDISELTRVNDTYLYNGIEVSANRTAKYNYRKLLDGSREPVKTHFRACVCERIPCVRICCPKKNMLANGKCNDGFNEEISLRMLNLTSYEIIHLNPSFEELRMAPLSNFTQVLVIRDQFQLCDKMFSLKEDEYGLLKYGSLILHSTKKIWLKKDYCLYPQFNSDFSSSIWVVKHTCLEYSVPGHNEIRVISIICYFLTVSVYLYVKKLRNVLGKCLISSFLCLIIVNLFRILETFNFLNPICLLEGYSRYFFKIAFHLWNSSISFHLWKVLTNRNEPSSFGTYSAFAWSLAAIPTGVIYLVNLIWEKDLHKWNWLPLVGYAKCWLEARGPSFWIFLHGPVLTLTLLNIIMFVLTVINIWKVKRELRKFKRDEERTIQCFNFDTETFLLYLRLFVIMGVIWIVDYVPFQQGNVFWIPVYYFIFCVDFSFGIIAFMVLILKRSTFKVIMERIRGRR